MEPAIILWIKLINTGSSHLIRIVCYYIYFLILNSVLLLDFRLCSILLSNNYFSFSFSGPISILLFIWSSLEIVFNIPTINACLIQPNLTLPLEVYRGWFLILSTCFFMQFILCSYANFCQAKDKLFVCSVAVSKEFFGLYFVEKHRPLKYGP